MSIVNLNRDLVHVGDIKSTGYSFPATGVPIGKTCWVQNSTFVMQDANSAQGGYTPAAPTAGNWTGIGCLIDGPRVDATPYRVKAYCAAAQAYLVIGHAPETPMGMSDEIQNCIAVPFKGQLDEVLLLNVEDNPTFENRALCFAVAVGEGEASTVTHISVQKLSKAPPRYASVTS